MERNLKVFSRQVSYSWFRSDNNVKNHFFSKLRLSLRQLNKVIIKLLGAKKQIKSHILYKITSICELKFKDSSNEKLSLI